MLTWIGMEYAWESWELREQLMTTWRPPAYFYKAVIPLSSGLILLQGIAEVLKCVKTLHSGVDYRDHDTASEIT
jgi:TRAP-type mannitol/chloroaromatic compound transport system permease small subunit